MSGFRDTTAPKSSFTCNKSQRVALLIISTQWGSIKQVILCFKKVGKKHAIMVHYRFFNLEIIHISSVWRRGIMQCPHFFYYFTHLSSFLYRTEISIREEIVPDRKTSSTVPRTYQEQFWHDRKSEVRRDAKRKEVVLSGVLHVVIVHSWVHKYFE